MRLTRRYEGPSDTTLRTDRWLHLEFPDVPRSTVQSLIEKGAVLLNGKPVKASHRLRPGDEVSFDLPEVMPSPQAPQPLNVPLELLFQDDDIVIVNKQAGLTVHPGPGVKGPTMVHALLYHVGRLSGIGGPFRPGIVHRLDQGTSGVMVVARTDFAHRALVRQFESRKVQKDYLALVWGRTPEHGTLHAAVGRHPKKRHIMSVRPDDDARGRPAFTSWQRLESDEAFSLLRLHPHTGRTHQLRVHLNFLKHPIVGDPAYGVRASQGQRNKLPRDHPVLVLKRPLLHALKLSFTHPREDRLVTYEAPLPADFRLILDCLGLRAD